MGSQLKHVPDISSSVWGDCFPRLAALTAAYLVMQFIVFLFKRHHRHKTFERMKINGPKPHFIHGHLYDTRRQPYVKFAHKMHEKYGKNVGIYLGGDPYLMTKDLDLIQQVFVARSRTFYDRMNFYLNIDPVPDNLICQRGDRWRYMRKLLTPAFTNSKIRSSYFYRDTHQTVRKFMRQLEENSKLDLDLNGNIRQISFVEDSYDRMAAVALDVIVKTAFHMDNVISFSGQLSNQSQQHSKGKQISPDLGKSDIFLNTVKRACRLAFNPLVELIFCFPFLDLPLTFLCNRLYFGSIVDLLFKRLDYLVRRSEFSLEENCDKSQQQVTNTDQRRRIIDSLIEVLRERKITKSEFTGNAFVIVFAGFETTANALTFTLWLLAKNQRVQKKLRRELLIQMQKVAERNGHQMKSEGEEDQFDEKSLPKSTANSPTRADIELAELAFGCEYLEMVINESLRLYPPVPGLSCRQASVECTLPNGLHIEKGVNIIPSVFSIHRDKEIWGEEANEFKPERFETIDLAQLNSAMFMPFGLGPRNCIGKAAAMHEMKIVIGRLILAYSIEACTNETPDKLKLCSPINITITNSEKIGLRFVKLEKSDLV